MRDGGTVVADLGGSNTDLLYADGAGRVLRTAVQPALTEPKGTTLLDLALPALGLQRADLTRIVVTGGRHRALPNTIEGLPVCKVDEIAAIACGGLAAAGVDRALVVSMGTGTAMVSTDGVRHQHTIGTALGGGLLLGLSRRLLGTTDPLRIAALAEAGNPARANLTIADIIGSGVGDLPGDAPAAYLARLAGASAGEIAPADLAAALLAMIGQVTGQLAWLTARNLKQDCAILTGHMVDFPVVRTYATAFGRLLAGGMIVPEEPGSAIARGALAVALR